MSSEPHAHRANRLDVYVDRYAARTAGMTASEIRALFSVASRPEVVSLAGGMPNIQGLPLDVVGGAIGDLIADNGPAAMQYGSGQGSPELREQICDVMRLEGIDAHPDDVVVTVGSQQAVDLVTRIFCDPGDVVLCEAPSLRRRAGRLPRLRGRRGAHRDGRRRARAGVAGAGDPHRPGGGASDQVPLHDPELPQPGRRHHGAPSAGRRCSTSAGGTTCSCSRTTRTGCSASTTRRYRALRADEPDGVIYLGSFSKTFAPGFRVGWAVAPHAVREKLVLAQESATLCPPTFSQLAVSAYLAHHDWRGQIKDFRAIYRERRDAMLDALDG